MKQFLFSMLIAAVPWAALRSQYQQNYYSSGNTVVNSAVHITAGNVYLGPTSYQASGSAKLDVSASHYVRLQPGFSITGLNSTGEGHFYIVDVASFHPNGYANILRYDRFELGINLPQALQDKIDAFLANYAGSSGSDINPYDPDEIYVECVYHLPSGGTVRRPGFYYQPYSTISNTYTELGIDHPFRIRIAPPEAGLYTCEINIYTGGFPTPAYSFGGIQFNVVTSPNPGHLIMASANLRKLKFENGSYFFGIGQNLGGPTLADPWHENGNGFNASPSFNYLGNGVDARKLKASPNTNMRFRNEIRDLANNKGNFARMRLDENSFPLEYADYRSLSSNNYSLPNCLTNFHHNQMFLAEFDSALFVCEKKGVHIMLNLFNEIIFNSSPQNVMLWDDYPYNTIPDLVDPNRPTVINDFFISPDARERFKKRLLYIHARWGYSTSLGLWEFINETENIVTYHPSKPGYNSNLQGYVSSWVCEMSDYMHNFYPRHVTTNGTVDGSFNNYSFNTTNAACLDVYSKNMYSNEIYSTGAPSPSKDGAHQQGADMWNTQHPFIWGELGMGVECAAGAISTEAWMLPDNRNDRSFHNYLWATTVSGNAATGLNFMDAHQEFNVQHRQNYNSLSDFVSHVNWYTELAPHRWNDSSLGNMNMSIGFNPGQHELYNLYMRNNNHDYAAGWTFMRPSFWAYDVSSFTTSHYNSIVACVGLNPSLLDDYDISLAPQEPAIEVRDMALPNHTYRAEIFDTYYSATSPFSIPVQSGPDGTIRFHLSFFNHDVPGVHQYMPDRAWIIHDDADVFNFNQQHSQPDEIYRARQFESDLLPGHQYGRSAAPGATSVENADTTAREMVRMFPNPASASVYLQYNAHELPDLEVLIYNMAGKLVQRGKNVQVVDVSELEQGLYMMRLRSGKMEKAFKLNIVR